MRGTKHANDATAKRLGRQLRQLLEDPNAYLPDMTWKGRLSWGRRDPVTKTLLDLKKIVAKKDDVKWLSKRMLAKRGDPVGKALAGSLHAAHDEEISLVGNFKSPNFGSGSFIRRGDGSKAILQVCRTIKTSHYECYLGRIMLGKACTSSLGRKDLSVQAQTQHRQRVGWKMFLIVHGLISSMRKSGELKFTSLAKSKPMTFSTAYLLHRVGFAYPSNTDRLLESICNL